MDRKVIILSGLSGSGKSTYANALGGVVCSADDFFVNDDGKYVFDPAKLQDAHAYCFRSFLEALQGTNETIVVDNTNTRVEEISPYVLASHAFGIEPKIVTVIPWQFAPAAACLQSKNPFMERNFAMSEDQLIAFLSNRNSHGVGSYGISRQLNNITKRLLPAWWNHEFVIV